MSLFSFFARPSRSARDAAPTPAPAEMTESPPPDSAPADVSLPGPRAGGEFCWQRSIPSRSDVGKAVIDEIVRQLEALCWNAPDLFGVRLALEEAVINAIKHGK